MQKYIYKAKTIDLTILLLFCTIKVWEDNKEYLIKGNKILFDIDFS